MVGAVDGVEAGLIGFVVVALHPAIWYELFVVFAFRAALEQYHAVTKWNHVVVGAMQYVQRADGL